MIRPNWNQFKSKFNDNSTYYFEYFCYLLFCLEYNKPQGVFRYKNQSGIEWNPIEVDGKTIVAQCKFYDTPLGSNKVKILEMLDTIHKNYTTPCELKFYTNQDWGQGTKQETNDSQPKKDIEAKAKEYNITIDWRTNETYFLSPDVAFNQDLMKHFFTNESIYDLVYEKQTHTQRLLNDIHSSINFNSQIIEIDRTIEINELENQFKNHQALILSGAGGVGKTAIVKKLYKKINNEVPLYLFKASEFETNQIDNLFGNYSLQKFLDIHQRNKEKIIIIDSAEKILDINNRDPFKEFVTTLLAHKWKILFTTRYSYLDDLNHHLLEMLNIIPYRVDIQNLSNAVLSALEEKYDFNLPVDEKLLELLKNPFYLNEYLSHYTSEKINYQDFKNQLWNQNITKSNPQREQCFLKLVSSRANEGQFYINIECLSNSLEEFRKEGLLGYETAGYFITHDIYEEWALNQIIETAFIKRTNESDFFVQIGSSLPIRRAFRGWISDKLLFNDDSIKSFIENIVDEPNIESYWKDEIFVAILLSDYSETFFQNFDRELQANGYELLERISFLLRIACKEIDDSLWEQIGLKNQAISEIKYIFTQPKGHGWNSFIAYIYDRIETIKLQKINIILPVLYDWNSKFKEGEITRKASLIALKYYDWIYESGYYRHDENIKTIFNVIINGSSEIKSELSCVFDEIIEKKLTNHSDKYYELCTMILSKLEGFPISNNLPEYVLKIADLFWTYTPKNVKDGMWRHHEREEVEHAYGLTKYRLEYSPSSAYQTPIYRLLKSNFKETIDFILEFVNKSVEHYAISKWKYQEEIQQVEVLIDDHTIIQQYHSQALWNMYRGGNLPDLLESIHMALEKYLLEIGKILKPEDLNFWLLYLLNKSKSSSISAVVTSVVLAYPDKIFNIALILFRVKEFLECDFTRSIHEDISYMDMSFNTNSKIYSLERAEELKREHRKESLSGIMLKYQLINSGDGLEKKKLIENIIDDYYVDIEKEPIVNQSWKLFLLTKIDVRKMHTKHEKTSNNQPIISFTPQLDEKSKKYQKLILKDIDERNKYIQLSMWADYKLKNNDDFKKYDIYSSDIALIFTSMKEILELHEDKNYNCLYPKEIPAMCSCILLRDFNESLTDTERVFCKELFLKHIFTTSHNSISIEYYINVLPSLINIFPEEKNDIKYKLLELLRLGYGIVAMMEMWDIFYEDISSILIAYLVLEPLYDKKYDEYRKKRYEDEFRENFSRTGIWNEVLKENNEILEKMNSNELTTEDISDFNSIDIDILSKVFNILPDEMNTQETQDLSFALNSVIASKMLSSKDDKIDFQTKNNFCLKLSYIMLNSTTNKIDIYLVPFLKNFNSSEIISTFFNELIKAENSLNKYNNFWYIWKSFQSSVIELCKNGDRFTFIDKIVSSYLFSSNNILGQGIFPDSWTSWHSLQPRDKRFFKEMSGNIGHCPSTLYSISKFLTSIGSNYLNDGIAWISNMLRNNSNLSTDKLEADTIFHLEILIRKYIFLHTEKIKREKKTKEDTLIILNFLIEKGSSLAYMLRERIL